MTTTLILALGAALLQATPAREARSAPGAGAGFFRSCVVDFWGEKKTSSPPAPVDGSLSRESIWAEPIRQPDGRMSVYVPPKPVLQFLEDPTRERAREYLAWQEERAKKLKTAMEVLRDLRDEDTRVSGSRPAPAVPGVDAPASPPLPPPAPAAANLSIELLYFKKKGCPWCVEQDKVLAELTRAHPGIRVRTATPESAPELWAEHEVKVVPMIVVPAPLGRKVKLRGFISAERILSVIEEVNRAAP